jgi:Isochorismatase family
VLAGIATNLGVESTARVAWELGYEIVFAEDAMASLTADMDEVSGSELLTVGGRYELDLARLAEGWRICRRIQNIRYKIGDPTLVERAKRTQAERAASNAAHPTQR